MAGSKERKVTAAGGTNPAFLRRGAVVPRRSRAGRVVRWMLAAAVVVAAGGALSRFLGGSLFAIARFEVTGNKRARTQEVLAAVEPWRSANLISLDLSEVALAIGRHPWVDRVTLAKRFPDALVVRIIERRPVALYRDGAELWWVSEGGRPIAPYDPRADSAEYVLLSGGRRHLTEAVAILEDLRSMPPEYFSALSEISALSDGGFGIMDSVFRKPVRVLRRDAPAKIRALLEARSLIESRGWEARAIDLRFADRIVLVGAYGAGNSL